LFSGATSITQKDCIKSFSFVMAGQLAFWMGWPEFPGEDESLPAPAAQAQVDRAHFFQAYRADVSRRMHEAGELPAVREYVLERRGNAVLPFRQELKKLVGRIEK
jgi:hypothetical protein